MSAKPKFLFAATASSPPIAAPFLKGVWKEVSGSCKDLLEISWQISVFVPADIFENLGHLQKLGRKVSHVVCHCPIL